MGQGAEHEGDRANDRELNDPDEADPDELAGQQRARTDSREDDLDHPGRLLLDHALGDEVAVEAESHVERESDDDAEKGLLGALGVNRLEALDLDLRPRPRLPRWQDRARPP